MKKIALILLTTTLFSCNVSKKINKSKVSEENITQTEVKTDSISETKRELEFVSTFVTDVKEDFFDFSETKVIEVFNDSGVIKQRTTIIKTNIKSKKTDKSKESSYSTQKEQNKTNVNTLFEHKEESKSNKVELAKDIKKNNTSIWLWITFGIGLLIFILVAIWKIKKKYFHL
jgi:thiol:disulfide interchange protein